MNDFFVQAYQVLAPWIPLLTSISVLLALVSLILVPVLIVKMPDDYFLAARRRRHKSKVGFWYTLLRNFMALILLIAGVIMLFAPGQGLLTILVALAVSDVSGKYRMERWIILRPGVLKAINWVRKRYHKTPIKRPPVGYKG
ncbi:hypothetical protein CWE09_09960 [Aliidiomarina minuta]|uniref:Transmembrane protein (PGPGW) n=1 Tax=Aliidiomarina minuta TaxID=880057 RepID=A0A432WA16_9GAMM|nr:hypothetical protein [Aliidiomarina minuta]RUO26993.1 hypothetical protein CWE09_09960 [Aliidiomarina minuta]